MVEETFYEEVLEPEDSGCDIEHELECIFEQDGPRILVTVDCADCHHHEEYHLETNEREKLRHQMDSMENEDGVVHVSLNIHPEGPLDANAKVEVEYEDGRLETQDPSYYFNA